MKNVTRENNIFTISGPCKVTAVMEGGASVDLHLFGDDIVEYLLRDDGTFGFFESNSKTAHVRLDVSKLLAVYVTA